MEKSQIKTRQEKPERCFVFIVAINLVILLIVITGIIMGIHDYISDTKFTYRSVTCCGSICLKCFFSFYTLTTVLPWVCILILFTGLCKAIYRTISVVSWNCKFTRLLSSLPLESNPKLENIATGTHFYNYLVVVNNNQLHAAFTHGFLNPKAYLTSGICSYLTDKELQSVILHEMHHVTNRDPLKLFIIQILCTLNFFLPINYFLLNKFSLLSEKAADDNVVKLSGEPLELASAMVKICKSNTIAVLNPMTFSFQGQNIEERINRLLEPEVAPPCPGKSYVFFPYVLSFFVMISMCLSLFYKPVVFMYNTNTECTALACHIITCK